MRQQRHRLKNIRPQQFAPPGSDPLLLAAEALEHLTLVRRAVASQPRALKRLEEISELVRQLGWGPSARDA